MFTEKRPFRAVVASTNPEKVEAVRHGLSRLFGNKNLLEISTNIVVDGIALTQDEIGVSYQPNTSIGTMTGAKNRAAILCEKYKNKYDVFIGIEGGVLNTTTPESHVHDWLAIYNNAGHLSLSFDGQYPLPREITNRILMGTEMGPACDEVFGTGNIKQNGGMTSLFTRGLICRGSIYSDMTVQGMINYPEFMKYADDDRELGNITIDLLSRHIEYKSNDNLLAVALGSNSKLKIAATSDAFKTMFRLQDINVFDYDFGNELRNLLPHSTSEVYQMAMARAHLASTAYLHEHGKRPDYAVGIQGGINRVPVSDTVTVPMVINAAFVIGGSNTKDSSRGQAIGGGYTIPNEFWDTVKKHDLNLGSAADAYFGMENLKYGIGFDGEFTRGHITRHWQSRKLMMLSLIPFVNSKYY